MMVADEEVKHWRITGVEVIEEWLKSACGRFPSLESTPSRETLDVLNRRKTFSGVSAEMLFGEPCKGSRTLANKTVVLRPVEHVLT